MTYAPVQNYCLFTHTFPTQGSHDVRVHVQRSESMTVEYQETVTVRDYLIVSL